MTRMSKRDCSVEPAKLIGSLDVLVKTETGQEGLCECSYTCSLI